MPSPCANTPADLPSEHTLTTSDSALNGKPMIASNIFDTALVLEGGGMRGAYTAGVVTALLEEGLFFDHVSGISAGSSNTVNYLARDPQRIRFVFTDVAQDPRFGGWGSFLRGRGYFNVDFLYGTDAAFGDPFPFDWDTFQRNPATMRIGVFDAVAGREHWLGKDAITTPEDLMRVVRSSSTLPLIMPSVHYQDTTWMDGGLGPDGGIALDAAIADGFEKFFVVLTRPRGYVKPPLSRQQRLAARALLAKYPAVADGMIYRPSRYNTVRRQLEDLERRGQAYVFYPEDLNISNIEHHPARLDDTFQAGLRQARAEAPRWHQFLGV